MPSIFDSAPFNESLFFPRDDDSAPPPGASDLWVDVGEARVHVRCHAVAGARCTLLLFHGNGEIAADYDATAQRFAKLGAALAIAEFRGYGQSDGVPTLRTLVRDARPIAEAVPGAPLIVMGRSLGGVPAHELFARPTDRMAGVIFESAFFDLDNLIHRRGMRPPDAYTAEERAAFEPDGKLRIGRLPLLVLHGGEDETIDPSEAEAAHAAAGSRDKQLVFVPGHGHNDLSASDVYWRALDGFLDRALA